LTLVSVTDVGGLIAPKILVVAAKIRINRWIAALAITANWSDRRITPSCNLASVINAKQHASGTNSNEPHIQTPRNSDVIAPTAIPAVMQSAITTGQNWDSNGRLSAGWILRIWRDVDGNKTSHSFIVERRGILMEADLLAQVEQ
jgi:hypothetical protein